MGESEVHPYQDLNTKLPYLRTMKPPQEHYILYPEDDNSFIEELEWYFEYNVPADRISHKNCSRITAAINKREGHTEFRTDGSPIDVEFNQSSGKFEIQTDRAILFADHLVFRNDYFPELSGFIKNQCSFRLAVETLVSSQHRFDFLDGKYCEYYP